MPPCCVLAAIVVGSVAGSASASQNGQLPDALGVLGGTGNATVTATKLDGFRSSVASR